MTMHSLITLNRAVAMLLVEESNKPPDTKVSFLPLPGVSRFENRIHYSVLRFQQALQTQIDRLDKILALRQIDQCYRLFLKTEVQRQSQGVPPLWLK